MSTAIRKPFELKGVHVLMALLAFFGVTIGMNVLFAVLAINSFPGEDAQSPYQQGLHYNQTLQARRAQEALGWRSGATIQQGNGGVVLRVTFQDAAGKPLDNLKIDGALRRPTADKFDIPVRLSASGDGLYEAALPGIEIGLWDFRARASDGEHTFDIDRRLVWRSSTRP
jgi:nitrogen fixation protein FixH